jgi:hypothetical protein
LKEKMRFFTKVIITIFSNKKWDSSSMFLWQYSVTINIICCCRI